MIKGLLVGILRQSLSAPIAAFLAFGATLSSCAPDSGRPVGMVTVSLNETSREVDVDIDGRPFTSYLFADSSGMLKKPVLFPVLTESGKAVTRGFPLEPRVGERADHPHQVGSWMNHGDVAWLDFWNNSGFRPDSEASRFGTIRHKAVVNIESGEVGRLDVTAEWLRPDSTILLDEMTRFVFGKDADARFIDRTTTLTARSDTVLFRDSKEGMMAIRVARELELPTDRPDPFVEADGSLSEPHVDSSYATGDYLNSDGLTGADVWGRQAEWVVLTGTIDDEPIAVGMIDHPDNVGYPAYWMARDYGLFAADPLGARIFSAGDDSLDFTLPPRVSVTFRYRILIHSGSPVDQDWMPARQASFYSANYPPAR